MISLEKHLCPRQIVNPLKIRDCLVESEPPRNVTADDYNVIVRYRFRAIIVSFLRMTDSLSPEDVHRFFNILSHGEMQVSDCKNFHS